MEKREECERRSVWHKTSKRMYDVCKRMIERGGGEGVYEGKYICVCVCV